MSDPAADEAQQYLKYVQMKKALDELRQELRNTPFWDMVKNDGAKKPKKEGSAVSKEKKKEEKKAKRSKVPKNKTAV